MDEPSGCAAVRDLLPELAANVAAGDERARALRHLGGCADCRRELGVLATVVDELAALARPVEPPAGFESAVLARIRPAPRAWWQGRWWHGRWRPGGWWQRRWWQGRWWQRRALRLAATVLVAAAAGAGATMQATADDRRVADAYRRTLQIAGGRFLTAKPINAPDGSRAGRVFAYQGTPSWVFVIVEYDKVAGPYRVHLLTRDGQDRVIGEVPLAGGKGSWGAVIDVGVAQLAEIRLAGPGGPPLTAVFR